MLLVLPSSPATSVLCLDSQVREAFCSLGLSRFAGVQSAGCCTGAETSVVDYTDLAIARRARKHPSEKAKTKTIK